MGLARRKVTWKDSMTADLTRQGEQIVARGREVLRVEALRRLPAVLAAGPVDTFEERWRAELEELARDAQAAVARELAAFLGPLAAVEDLMRAGMRLAALPRTVAPGASAGGAGPYRKGVRGGAPNPARSRPGEGPEAAPRNRTLSARRGGLP